MHRAKLDGSEHEVFLNYNHSLGIVDGELSLKVKSESFSLHDFLPLSSFSFKQE